MFSSTVEYNSADPNKFQVLDYSSIYDEESDMTGDGVKWEWFKNGLKKMFTLKNARKVGIAASSALHAVGVIRGELFQGEQHPPLKLQDGGLTYAQYMGPFTHVLERILLGQNGLTACDRLCKNHDIDYILAASLGTTELQIAAVRQADIVFGEMLKRIQEEGLDLDYNIRLAKLVDIKTIMEDTGVFNKGAFKGELVALSDGDRAVYEDARLSWEEIAGNRIAGSGMHGGMDDGGGESKGNQGNQQEYIHVPQSLPRRGRPAGIIQTGREHLTAYNVASAAAAARPAQLRAAAVRFNALNGNSQDSQGGEGLFLGKPNKVHPSHYDKILAGATNAHKKPAWAAVSSKSGRAITQPKMSKKKGRGSVGGWWQPALDARAAAAIKAIKQLEQQRGKGKKLKMKPGFALKLKMLEKHGGNGYSTGVVEHRRVRSKSQPFGKGLKLAGKGTVFSRRNRVAPGPQILHLPPLDDEQPTPQPIIMPPYDYSDSDSDGVPEFTYEDPRQDPRRTFQELVRTYELSGKGHSVVLKKAASAAMHVLAKSLKTNMKGKGHALVGKGHYDLEGGFFFTIAALIAAGVAAAKAALVAGAALAAKAAAAAAVSAAAIAAKASAAAAIAAPIIKTGVSVVSGVKTAVEIAKSLKGSDKKGRGLSPQIKKITNEKMVKKKLIKNIDKTQVKKSDMSSSVIKTAEKRLKVINKMNIPLEQKKKLIVKEIALPLQPLIQKKVLTKLDKNIKGNALISPATKNR